MRNYEVWIPAVLLSSMLAVAQAADQELLQPWPYGPYDKNIEIKRSAPSFPTQAAAVEVRSTENPQSHKTDFDSAVAHAEAELARMVAADQETNRFPDIELPDVSEAIKRQKFESAVTKVLEEHGFVRPVFVQRPDDTWLAISARPRLKSLGVPTKSPYELLQAMVETVPGNRVTIQLVPYCWIVDDWAILGPRFQIPAGITFERAQIGRQIQTELRRERPEADSLRDKSSFIGR